MKPLAVAKVRKRKPTAAEYRRLATAKRRGEELAYGDTLAVATYRGLRWPFGPFGELLDPTGETTLWRPRREGLGPGGLPEICDRWIAGGRSSG